MKHKPRVLDQFFIDCTQKHVTHEMGTSSEKQKEMQQVSHLTLD